ncbi:hypothetical protein [Agriterribacter sp.]|uniref:hypothetical protein n=1 Tax=Agriterribacter sp. TaxID=2821509 RepID=UPI002B5FAFB3|nr:hypothetical protein [Agriterribacter sp.]HRO47461.1 hypothetical protein [Agriterribacter sp.]HRQ15882.1 hypothetical protein [Agriterribacter sp.]
MKRNSDIEKELREISPVVAELGNDHVFQAPPGYFEDLPQKVLTLIKLNEEHTELPANEEIKQLSPLIAALKNKSALSVPPGYFNAFPQHITDKLKLAEREEETPVIRMNTGKKRKWMNYVAAAAVTGVIAISALFLLNTSSREAPPLAQNEDIQPVSSRLPEIADIDLAGYLSAVPETPEWLLENADAEFEQIAFLKIDDSNLSDLLKDIPDEILRNYEQDISVEVAL